MIDQFHDAMLRRHAFLKRQGDRSSMTEQSHDKSSHAEIDEGITLRQEVTGPGAIIRLQPFWVFMAIMAIGVVMTFALAAA